MKWLVMMCPTNKQQFNLCAQMFYIHVIDYTLVWTELSPPMVAMCMRTYMPAVMASYHEVLLYRKIQLSQIKIILCS